MSDARFPFEWASGVLCCSVLFNWLVSCFRFTPLQTKPIKRNRNNYNTTLKLELISYGLFPFVLFLSSHSLVMQWNGSTKWMRERKKAQKEKERCVCSFFVHFTRSFSSFLSLVNEERTQHINSLVSFLFSFRSI